MKNLLSQKIRDDLFYIGVNDRNTQLFEAMWPLPDGVAYNSYLVKGSKNILFDLVKETEQIDFFEKLREVLGPDEKIDYLIINHMEPDHTSGIVALLARYPDVKIITNKKALPFLKNFYDVEKNIDLVEDGQTIQLGDHDFTFYMTPMVHWPESMVAYEEKTKTLFSQDIFGGFGTLDGAIFDDQVEFDKYYLDETNRYFINIVGKYAQQAVKALEKLAPLEIKMICPDHGPIWRKNPKKIMEIYTSLAKQETEKGVAIIFGSMYGNTERMAQAVAKGVAEAGLTNIRMHDVSKTAQSYLLADCWKYKGIILGSCSYNNNIFPVMGFLLQELKHQRMKNNIWGFFGSYSWNGGAMKEFKKFVEENKCNTLESFPEIQGSATDEELEELKNLGREMAKRILED
ncbi:FprA family A-type flavoprotein [Peptoniphilus sp. GNH]|nr:metallo-beta-lactamase domain protein [Clostridiales bacterium KA00134]UHR02318.1 FprA family A-type flavoprotein [Peptoniphilus sp. GNH]